MFNALTTLTRPTARPVGDKKTTLIRARAQLRAARLALTHRRTQMAMSTSLTTMAGLTKDFSDLRLLRGVIRSHGINRSLMAFVNPGKGIGHVVQGLPANESLDAVSLTRMDPRVKTALEGLDTTLATEPGLVADWVRTGADNLDTLLGSVKAQSGDLGQAISHYLVELEDAAITEDQLQACTATLLPQDQAMARMACLLGILPDLDADVSDPTDRDAMDAHQAQLATQVADVGEATGLAVDADNPHQLIKTDVAASYQPQDGSLFDLGYTQDNAIALLKQADALLDELEGLVARKEALVGSLNTTADMVSGLDNDVPPAVDAAIPGPDDDVSDEPGMLSQCDVVHCHVSSHMICFSTVLDAAMLAVQESLMAAQMLDELDGNDVFDGADLGEDVADTDPATD